MENRRQLLLDTFNYRFATKRFDASKKISEADFNTILETGRLSPSSLGFEPWQFVVIQDPAIRDALKPMSWSAQGQLDTASHFVVILARKNVRPENKYVQHLLRDVKHMDETMIQQMSEKTTSFQDKNLNLYESDRALWDWASKQTYIALGNMMTSAAFLGIDSCPIEGFQYDEVAELLTEKGIIDDENFAPSVMVAFGYREEDPKREKTRQTQSEIVKWV
ncbi:NAD(P)H-dependent oxidoreductase [Staphylococcus coagulans]|uniref:NAD(P)H-dependent oxidoreductase n=1 Tax=Staphylococcus coagulans TaxID=74706 RepID=UPI001BECE715|nr:NAD(P)H-dependent oxidoreductase [Staphylococcus coagulans]MBT2814373.1 NAD(P)H-dependent oxidoreductase [Staphylococcus coagulans]MBT2837348.1 NAD(P)H-dependent oxidoreductase [Staphylococcus coagulans]MBT2841859.1 NAD(P)H-dependent oxidoreductase [Staphylococcus coagulans]MBT2855426.1 NAD(P)H-dependent oxidoreductase [Staphylococcus coagulans]